MQTILNAGVFNGGLTLQQLVNNLLKTSKPLVHLNHTFVANEIAGELVLEQGKDRLIPIMHDLLTIVLAHSKNGDIHISADRYHDIITLLIEERNNYNGYALECSLSSIEQDARKIGGHISIKDPRRKIAVVSFSFPNYTSGAKACA